MGLFKAIGGVGRTLGETVGLVKPKAGSFTPVLADTSRVKALADKEVTGTDIAGKAALDAGALQFLQARDDLSKSNAGLFATQMDQLKLLGGSGGGAMERASRNAFNQGTLGAQGLMGQQALNQSNLAAANIADQVATKNKGIFTLAGLDQANVNMQNQAMAGNLMAQQLAAQSQRTALNNTLGTAATAGMLYGMKA